MRIQAIPAARAIYTQAGMPNMGTISLEDLSDTGQVSIIVRGGTKKLKLAADKLHVAALRLPLLQGAASPRR